jgi:hypothetical protein
MEWKEMKEMMVKQGLVVDQVLKEVLVVKKDVKALKGEVVEVQKQVKDVETHVEWMFSYVGLYTLLEQIWFWFILMPNVEVIYKAAMRK